MQQWRDEKQLPFPDFTPPEISARFGVRLNIRRLGLVSGQRTEGRLATRRRRRIEAEIVSRGKRNDEKRNPLIILATCADDLVLRMQQQEDRSVTPPRLSRPPLAGNVTQHGANRAASRSRWYYGSEAGKTSHARDAPAIVLWRSDDNPPTIRFPFRFASSTTQSKSWKITPTLNRANHH